MYQTSNFCFIYAHNFEHEMVWSEIFYFQILYLLNKDGYGLTISEKDKEFSLMTRNNEGKDISFASCAPFLYLEVLFKY